MEVTSRTVSQLFQGGGDVHYILPHFQRQYAWEKEDWVTLLEDAYRYFMTSFLNACSKQARAWGVIYCF